MANPLLTAIAAVAIQYKANNLFFRWTIADYSIPFHNQYYCKLKGIDADWRYTGNRGEIQYANLSPGNYELLLRGITANGIVGEQYLQVAFTIHGPFWKPAGLLACNAVYGATGLQLVPVPSATGTATGKTEGQNLHRFAR